MRRAGRERQAVVDAPLWWYRNLAIALDAERLEDILDDRVGSAARRAVVAVPMVRPRTSRSAAKAASV